MHPVICFYDNQHLIYSLKYQLISCQSDQDVNLFLSEIDKTYSSQMKIVKLNYSALDKSSLSDSRRKFANTPKAQVYILKDYSLITQNDLELLYPKKQFVRPVFRPLQSEQEFASHVMSAKVDIFSGRFYQMNYTSALEASSLDSYDLLNDFVHTPVAKVSYKAFLPLDLNENICCLSPELFLQKKGSKIITQPIKGTVLAGETISELNKSNKEAAELSMIVDLLRNDLNSLSCEKFNDSARVNFHRKIMDLNYTAHTYSEIEINTSKKFSEIIELTFPGGSISGCPKKESLKKISEIEIYQRDFYTGSIGWWKDEDFCLNIAIRSIYQKDKRHYYFAGCGIVADSDPRNEWREFLTKSSFLDVSLDFDPIIDTLKFENLKFVYLDEHIERTNLAYQAQFVTTELSQIQDTYAFIQNRLATQLNSKLSYKVRIVFEKDLTYKLDFTELPNLSDQIKLQLIHYDQHLPKYKTSDRSTWDKILKLKNHNADDVLIVNSQGNIVEASIYNIFYKLNDVFYTPPLSDGCLYGTLRSYFLKSGTLVLNDQKFKIFERSLPASDLKNVELYVGNSVRGLIKATVV